MVCLGTVADVMPLCGENRVFVSRGLAMLKKTRRPGIAALMELTGCDRENLTATNIGYTIAPRINAAGRMGEIDLALQLVLTRDPETGRQMAQALCDLNKQRQAVEAEIYAQAVEMLPEGQLPDAIVLADESWHQGVVGIVASRICEEYSCPTFLICLDGEHGKASSRSHGGFNLVAAFAELSPLLESYGGHEPAAGFTIRKDNITTFRQEICRLARNFYDDATPRTLLEADCEASPELLTIPNIDALSQLEPCGNGCPKPILVTDGLTIDRVIPTGSGKHVRLRLRWGNYLLQGIWFGASAEIPSLQEGDLVDVAYIPQVNEFRGERSVQLNIQDVRPSCRAECSLDTSGYQALRAGTLDAATAAALLPDRATLGSVWRFLASLPAGTVTESPDCLCRKLVRYTNLPMSLGKLLVCLDIFRDVGLLELQKLRKNLTIRLIPTTQKADLNQSVTLQQIAAAKES